MNHVLNTTWSADENVTTAVKRVEGLAKRRTAIDDSGSDASTIAELGVRKAQSMCIISSQGLVDIRMHIRNR